MSETVGQNFYARQIIGIEKDYGRLRSCFKSDDDDDEEQLPYYTHVKANRIRPFYDLDRRWYAIYAETDVQEQCETVDGFTTIEALSKASDIIEAVCAPMLVDGLVSLGPVSYHSQLWHNSSDRPSVIPEETAEFLKNLDAFTFSDIDAAVSSNAAKERARDEITGGLRRDGAVTENPSVPAVQLAEEWNISPSKFKIGDIVFCRDKLSYGLVCGIKLTKNFGYSITVVQRDYHTWAFPESAIDKFHPLPDSVGEWFANWVKEASLAEKNIRKRHLK